MFVSSNILVNPNIMIVKKALIFLFFVAVLLLEFGCTHYKNIVYMQDRYEVKDTAIQAIPIKESNNIVLQTGDNLYINLYGADLGQFDVFNKQTFVNPNYTEYSLYMQGYIIDEDGYVEIPVVHKIKVEGLTLTEAQQAIQKKLDEYIVDVIAEVRLLSFQITVLGEVRRPGTYTFLKRNISILDALGKSGDILDFGDRRNVLVVRKKGETTETFELDMTSSDFFQSSFYWLEPNDVVYVKPLRAKMITVNSSTISIVLASLTTLILLLTYIQ